VLVRATGTGARVQVSRDLADVRRDIWSLASVMTIAGGAALLTALAGGWWIAGRALAPIDRISDAARAMADGDLHARIEIDRVETELGQVAVALNTAFDRLHAALERQQRFSADASHELRTPLAALSTEAQWALSRDRDIDTYRDSLAACLRSVERMRSIVERLLAIARADAGIDTRRITDVALDDLVRDIARELAPLASQRQIRLDVSTEPAVVRGDRDWLSDAVTNVIVNAIQYNVDGGEVKIALRGKDGRAGIVIADTGVGIAAEALPCVFEPFYRADPARDRAAGGAGLGLALAKSIIERHHGTISCTSPPGQGTIVVITL
jgi:heavy metal sensor kinase